MAEEYEKVSNASQPLDEIIAIRAQDPKVMKPGQETQLNNNAFSNKNFFRQNETSKKVPAFNLSALKSQYFDSTMQHLAKKFFDGIQKECEEASIL